MWGNELLERPHLGGIIVAFPSTEALGSVELAGAGQLFCCCALKVKGVCVVATCTSVQLVLHLHE